ncbi:MAG: hypothetical protein H6642_12480 [Caldilineaceae bacterium]|nr:hypothetical protein [Caldilineaceae bacterium]
MMKMLEMRKMKWLGVLFLCLAAYILSPAMVNAQQPDAVLAAQDPYVYDPVITPAPLLPAEFGGAGNLSFKIGNLLSEPLTLYPDPAGRMTVKITLSYGEPDGDPLAVISGVGAGWFDWSYDATNKTYTGVQNQDIGGSVLEPVVIAYKVTQNSYLTGTPANGFNVNIQPGNHNNQVTDNDKVSAYTYVAAYDFGDAPESYGIAEHKITVDNPATFMYLGTTVDPEFVNQASLDATGDDANESNTLNPTNDENGVTFPVMKAGDPVVIPVVLSFGQTGAFLGGYLNAWIDWNADGDFADTGEQIADSVTIGADASSKTYSLSLTIPSDAKIAKTIARFRFGADVAAPGDTVAALRMNNVTPEDVDAAAAADAAAYGEVEDYQIEIVNTTLAVALSYNYAERDGDTVYFIWETAAETGNAGFNLYMELADGSEQLANDEPAPSSVIDSVTPTRYTYQANVAGDSYAIDFVHVDGSTERYGPFQIGEEYGEPTVADQSTLTNPLYLPLIISR